MRHRTTVLSLVLAAAAATSALGQSRTPRIVGTWRAETPDGPREVVIRADSSASYGEETVRWRLIADSVFLAFGDEWVGYVVAFRGDRMTVSGGDLEEPMTLRRAGPATPRPDSIPIPPPPPMARGNPDQPAPRE